MSTRNPIQRIVHQWTPKDAGSCHDWKRKYRSVANALRLIQNSAECDLREALIMLGNSTHEDPVLLYEGKGMLWLGTEAEKL